MKLKQSPLLALTLAGLFAAPLAAQVPTVGDVFGYPSEGTCWRQRNGDGGTDVLIAGDGGDQLFGDSVSDDLCSGGAGTDLDVLLGGSSTGEVFDSIEGSI